MRDTLPPQNKRVKIPSMYALTLPDDFSIAVEARRLRETVKPHLPRSANLDAVAELEYAIAAVVAVQFFLQHRYCVCLSCINSQTAGEPAFNLFFRAEVKHRTGLHPMKIAHTPIVSD